MITVKKFENLSTEFLKRYLVISTSTTKAVSVLQLEKGERLLEAKELTHEVVLK